MTTTQDKHAKEAGIAFALWYHGIDGHCLGYKHANGGDDIEAVAENAARAAWGAALSQQAARPERAAAEVPEVQRTAPERIYLDIGDNLEIVGRFDLLEGVTWSEDNATGWGIAYVRADLVKGEAS